MTDTSILGRILSRKHIPYTRRQLRALRKHWYMIRREDQTPPADNFWDVWVYAAGRGAGKTRVGAEETVAYAEANPGARLLLVGRTAADARNTMIEGESGVFAVYEKAGRSEDAPIYQPSIRRLQWSNGSSALVMSADEPESLRGVQSHFTWADEAASYHIPDREAGKLSALDNIRLCTRLGLSPRVVITTTPSETEALEVIHHWVTSDPARVRLTSDVYTTDNRDNLSEPLLATITGMYGSAKGFTGELYGEWPWPL